ncbi:MAG: hypothetical protein AAFX40_17450, partial [Cyanobacteria bacterium J06639_1]
APAAQVDLVLAAVLVAAAAAGLAKIYSGGGELRAVRGAAEAVEAALVAAVAVAVEDSPGTTSIQLAEVREDLAGVARDSVARSSWIVVRDWF